jgi:hypothetical protein
LRPDEYNKLLTELEDCQLEFECLSKEMTRDEDQKKVTQTMQHMDILKSLFGQMEKYLGKILSEFEKSNLSKETIAKLSEEKFEKVKEFTSSLGNDKEKATRKFTTEFSDPFDTVIKTLVKEISK